MAEPASPNSGAAWINTVDGRPSPYFFRLMQDLWSRTGGFDNEVAAGNSLGLTGSNAEAAIGQIRKDVEQIKVQALLDDNSAALLGRIRDIEDALVGLQLLIPEHPRTEQQEVAAWLL